MKCVFKTKKQYMIAWRAAHREQLRAGYVKYYWKHAKKRRAQCTAWRLKHLEHLRAYDRARHKKHAKEERILALVQRAQIRVAVLNYYGGCCIGCGLRDIAVLTLDHTNGNGNKERRRKGRGSGSTFYAFLFRRIKLGKPKRTDIRVLCANCQVRAVRHGSDISKWPKQKQTQDMLTAAQSPIILDVSGVAHNDEQSSVRTAEASKRPKQKQEQVGRTVFSWTAGGPAVPAYEPYERAEDSQIARSA